MRGERECCRERESEHFFERAVKNESAVGREGRL
jgi:hypothetical protein